MTNTTASHNIQVWGRDVNYAFHYIGEIQKKGLCSRELKND